MNVPRLRPIAAAVHAAVDLESRTAQAHARAKAAALSVLRRRALVLRIRGACGGLNLGEKATITAQAVALVTMARLVAASGWCILPGGIPVHISGA